MGARAPVVLTSRVNSARSKKRIAEKLYDILSFP